MICFGLWLTNSIFPRPSELRELDADGGYAVLYACGEMQERWKEQEMRREHTWDRLRVSQDR